MYFSHVSPSKETEVASHKSQIKKGKKVTSSGKTWQMF
jgi:hypothetical protein